jgi:hypothetical protein
VGRGTKRGRARKGTYMHLVDRLERVDPPHIPLADLHDLAKRATGNVVEQFKRVGCQRLMLDKRNNISVAVAPSREGRKYVYSRRSVVNTDIDLARSTDEVVQLIVDIL